MTIAAILSGCNGWNEIEDCGHSKHAWFKGFLTLPSGIPSHDTFNRVFSALDPEELEKGFVAWVSSIANLTAGEVARRGGHWVLDVGFGEGLDRKLAGYAAQNFSVLNRIALNLLRQDKLQSAVSGIHGKRLKAGWDNDYLPHLLGN